MRSIMTAVLPFLAALSFSSAALAKGPTVKVTIRGADLREPIVITDAAELAAFGVWSGPGVSINGAADLSTSFADWKHRAFPYLLRDLPRYEVFFYAKVPEERLVYTVTYAFDPESAKGFIHIPGASEPSYRMNIHTILRGVEGKWFEATSAWDSLVGPLLPKTARPTSQRARR